MNKAQALTSLVPNAKWILKEDEDNLEWLSDDITQPTDAEIQAEIDRLQTNYDAKQYQRDRVYPSIGDQLDMLYHDIKAGNLETGDWITAIEQVKTDNPKPSE